jgi:hydroxymethylpyrimidine kinase/phosphomethylpyrimidine kinase
MPTRASALRKISCALTIAGLDPGGGAGIAADLRAFAAAGAFGCAVVALLTVQSTSGLVSSRPVPSHLVLAQAREVVGRQRVRALKIGALGSVDNVRAIARWLRSQPRMPSVVDPVLLPSRGRGRLLAERGLAALRDEVVPQALLVTANAPEAQSILDRPVTSVTDACDAALAMCALGARAALIKGGHLPSGARSSNFPRPACRCRRCMAGAASSHRSSRDASLPTSVAERQKHACSAPSVGQERRTEPPFDARGTWVARAAC